MLTEHNYGHEYAKEMAQVIERYRNGDDKALSDFAENVLGYVELLS